jgi:hypothetical protein
MAGRFEEAADLHRQAWTVADKHDNVLAAFAAAWTGCSGYEVDPRGHSELALRELSKPRQAQAVNAQYALRATAAGALACAGELTEARSLLGGLMESGFANIGPGAIYLFDSFEDLESRMTSNVSRYQAQGHRWIESQARTLGLGPVQAALGANERAKKSYEEAILIAANGCKATEIVAQVRLAALEATDGHIEKSKEHLSRCESIMPDGNGWRGHAGKMDVARAAITVAEGDLMRADDLFAQAIDNFREFTLPFEEAAALQMWGGALAESDPKRATERLDAAIDIYTSRDAGKGWIDRALKERHQLP